MEFHVLKLHEGQDGEVRFVAVPIISVHDDGKVTLAVEQVADDEDPDHP